MAYAFPFDVSITGFVKVSLQATSDQNAVLSSKAVCEYGEDASTLFFELVDLHNLFSRETVKK